MIEIMTNGVVTVLLMDMHGSESGGWWHTHCNYINLNYNYKLAGKGWGFINLAGTWYDPNFFAMKIRPVDCKV